MCSPYNTSEREPAKLTVARPKSTRIRGLRQQSEATTTGSPVTLIRSFNFIEVIIIYYDKDMKYIIKSILLLVLAVLFIVTAWTYRWYMGKTAPSMPDDAVINKDEKVAYVAGGCFWCTESDYEKIIGVKDVISGYMGGHIDNPSYNQVAGGESGHREVVKIVYDPNKMSYRRIALELLRETDPTDAGGSFYDRGHQYTSAIYYQTEEEKKIAEEIIRAVEERGVFDKPIATSIEAAGTFWVAEEYHQDYYKKNPVQYNYYRKGSGRDAFIESDLFEEQETTMSKWKQYQKPDEEALRKMLSPLQYKITQQEGTERAFDNEYWDNHEEGIYVDIISGEPLFSSTDKFDSGTGWPSFLRPLDKSFVTEHQDYKLIVPRTEIRSRYADSHLGHIILDGPEDNDKIRYCMNSAALRFVPKEELEQEGLGEYLDLFE